MTLFTWMKSPPRLAMHAVFSASARILTVAGLLLTTSVAARRMSTEEFGLWSILLALLFLALIFDFGFRYGLGNRITALVARAAGQPDPEQIRTFLSVLHIQALIGCGGALLCLGLFPHLPWIALFKIHQPDLAAQVPRIMALVGALLFLYIPFSLAPSVFFSYQEITLASVLSGAQSLILLAVFTVTIFAYPFARVVTCYFLAYLLTGILTTTILFLRRGWSPGWVPLAEQIRLVRSISEPSLSFFVLSCSAAITVTAATFLAGTVAGLRAAGDFALLQKIFSLLITLHLALLAPLAPAYTRHAQLGQWDWVHTQLQFSVRRIWPLLFVVAGGILWLLHPVIVRIWAGKWLADYTLAGLLALSALISGWTNTYSVLLNSLGLVRFQGVFMLLMVIPVLVLPLVLGRYWGVYGVALATLICGLPAALFWPLYTTRAQAAKRLNV